MLKLKWIKEHVGKGEYYVSKHADEERQNDNLTLNEIEEAISNGRVIERYDVKTRGKSCLIAGFTDAGKPLHIVCGVRGNLPVVITVYIPSPPKFKTPYERGEK